MNFLNDDNPVVYIVTRVTKLLVMITLVLVSIDLFFGLLHKYSHVVITIQDKEITPFIEF